MACDIHLDRTTNETQRHKKRAPKTKPYAVEFITPQRYLTHGWETWGGRYATLDQAQQAARDLQHSHARLGWKFRVAPPTTRTTMSEIA